MKSPLDKKDYSRDPRSRPASLAIPDGGYVFVRDEQGVIFVLPDGPHLHPKVPGGNQLAVYAGDLTKSGDEVSDLTNLSGTFQFDDPQGLLAVAAALKSIGFRIQPGAVRLFSYLDGQPPRVLR